MFGRTQRDIPAALAEHTLVAPKSFRNPMVFGQQLDVVNHVVLDLRHAVVQFPQQRQLLLEKLVVSGSVGQDRASASQS
jgi:hypothetical protein